MPPFAASRGLVRRALRLAAAITFLLTLAACGGGMNAGSTNVSASTSGSRAARFDAAWQTFDQQYSYFEYKHIDWNAARAQFRPRAEAATSDDELAATLRDMLAILHDEHVVVRNSAGITFPTYTPQTFINWDRNVWQQYVNNAGWVQGQSNWGYATFNGSGYIAIGAWNTEQVRTADLDAALERFRDAPALIIDVRMNPGGDDSLAFQFAGRFTTVTRNVGAVQFRNGPLHTDFGPLQARTVSPRGPWQFTRPVYVLVGRGCASSNESFIAAMREFPNVTIVGDTTAGSSGNPGFFDLGGGWQYSVSRWIEYTAGGTIIEGNGISPAVVIPASAADFQQGRDPVLDWIRAHAP